VLTPSFDGGGVGGGDDAGGIVGYFRG